MNNILDLKKIKFWKDLGAVELIDAVDGEVRTHWHWFSFAMRLLNLFLVGFPFNRCILTFGFLMRSQSESEGGYKEAVSVLE